MMSDGSLFNIPYLNLFMVLSAFLFGVLVGFAELLSRYKTVSSIIKSKSSWTYLVINGISSVLGLWLIEELKLLENFSNNSTVKVLIAGTSSMAILRSSFMNVKIGKEKTDIGLSALLNVFLSAAETSFDQYKSKEDLSKINDIMENVDFEKAKIALPKTCHELMKTFSDETLSNIGDKISKIPSEISDPDVQSIHLGLILYEETGSELLEDAVKVLGKSIEKSSEKEGDVENLDKVLNKLKEKF